MLFNSVLLLTTLLAVLSAARAHSSSDDDDSSYYTTDCKVEGLQAFRKAFLHTFSGSTDCSMEALHDLLTDEARVLYFLNNQPTEEPTLANVGHLLAAGYKASGQFVELRMRENAGTELLARIAMRLVSVESAHQIDLDGIAWAMRFDANCRIVSLNQHYEVAANTPGAVHALYEPYTDESAACPPGEMHRADVPALASEGEPTDCVPVSCRSSRACPNNACRGMTVGEARRNGGVGYTCGCGAGFELNGHTKRCEAVTCEAVGACSPLATCEDFNPRELDRCNPTPSKGEQWYRGSKPCKRFRCLPYCP